MKIHQSKKQHLEKLYEKITSEILTAWTENPRARQKRTIAVFMRRREF